MDEIEPSPRAHASTVRPRPSLERTIYYRVAIFALALIAVLTIGFASAFFAVQEHQDNETLLAQAESLADELNGYSPDEQVRIVAEQRSADVRITLIAADGAVLFDSDATSTEENHNDRPEVIQARATGATTLARQSATIDRQLTYAAVRLDDDAVLRLAVERQSMAGFMGSLALPLLLVAAIGAIISFLVSRSLSRRVLEPIEDFDVARPLDNGIYEEMEPLLVSIDRQQRQLTAQNEELARAESARREFSSNVSHELKTPLQVIAGYAELMQNGLLDPRDFHRVAGVISDESHRMRTLIDDVLILSRLDESVIDGETISTVDLTAVAKRVIDRLEPLADELAVTLTLEGNAPPLYGNETLLEMMLYNLVENAVRYNVEDGSVTLRLSESAEQDAGNAIIEVSDTGIGIPEDEQTKVFERFYRVEKSRSKQTGGTGLGLAIVKHAVAYHQGTINVTSEPSQGTTFTITLPSRIRI